MRIMHIRGFTLIESLIVISISVIIFLIVATSFATLWKLSQTNLAAFETKSQAGIALQKISELIEESNSVLSSWSINETLYQTGENVLALRMPAVTEAGEIIPASFDYVAFAIPSTSILIADFAKAPQSSRPQGQIIFSNLAKALNFRYNSSTSTEITTIEIFLETAKSAYDSTKTSTLSTVVKLKNK